MKYLLRSMLFGGLFFLQSLNACYEPHEIIEFTGNEVFIPTRLGKLKLYKDSDGFHIIKDEKIYDVQNCFCDRMLRKVSNEQLLKFLGRDKPKIIMLSPEEFSQLKLDDVVQISDVESEKLLSQFFHRGYISINQMDDGEYVLQAETGLLGGWPSLKKVLKGAAIGIGVCAGGVAVCAMAAGLAGATVIVGPLIIANSGISLGAGASAGITGIIGIFGAPTTAAIASLLPIVESGGIGIAVVGIPSLAAVGAAGGGAVAALTGERQPERPQANNPVAGPNAVYNEEINRVPLELDEISDF